MNDFLDVQRIKVPTDVIDRTISHLRAVGSHGYEGFALWVGQREQNLFAVKECVIPQQEGMRSERGVCVSVGPEELHRLNVWLYQKKYQLVGQVHSHPTDAYHSDTDDTFPIATTLGSISVVIPDFAKHGFVLADSAVYRLLPTEGWICLDELEKAKLLELAG